MKGNILYRIYYGDAIVYIGRTKQELRERIRGHFFAKPMHRNIDIFNVTRIEYAEFKTEADMFLYEVYFINKERPVLNVDDKATDGLTVELPPVEWTKYTVHLMDKWRGQLDGSTTHRRLRLRMAEFNKRHGITI